MRIADELPAVAAVPYRPSFQTSTLADILAAKNGSNLLRHPVL